MGRSPSQTVDELLERCERVNQQLDELKEEFGLPEKVNATPEQIVLLRGVLDAFTESQGNATIEELQRWVRANDTLDPNERVAIQSVLDDLLEAAPSEWRVQGEFSAWLDRRAEEAETVNVEIPVAGRTNATTETEIHCPLEPEGETYTEEGM